MEARVLRIQTQDAMDNKYGFERHKDSTERLGWLINMHPVSLKVDATCCYFIDTYCVKMSLIAQLIP